jgi:16S rRNA (adenine1518-N6/adenine1519-N6)-dimethyltransferase
MTPEQLKQFLRRYNLTPNKTFGQNFLLNDIVLQDIVDSVPLETGDAVLEVGPGIGNLTEHLLKRADFVLAVDKDEKFFPVLRRLKRDHKNFRFEFSDILKFNFLELLEKYPRYHVVANIPYYITGKLIQLFVRAGRKPKSITVLVQKEVARNVIAKPGQLNLLAISVQLFGQAKILMDVPARDFYPAPKVDSAVLQIILDDDPRYDIRDEKFFFKVLRACFAGKRKQIHNTLVNNLLLEKDAALKVLSAAKIPPQARPQELAIEQWLALVKEISLL